MKALFFTMLLLFAVMGYSQEDKKINVFSAGVGIGTTERGLAGLTNVSFHLKNNYAISGTFSYLDATRRYKGDSSIEFTNDYNTYIYDLTFSKKIKGFQFGLGYSYAFEMIEKHNFIIDGNELNFTDKNLNGLNAKLAYNFVVHRSIDFRFFLNNYFLEGSQYTNYKFVLGMGLNFYFN